MKLFIKRFIVFFGGIVGILIVFLFCWYNYYDFPPPIISNSVAFNAKALFIKKYYNKSSVDVMTLGSSMGLNNVDSGTLVANLNTTKYINISSWGLKIKNLYYLLKIFYKKYTPKIVVISSNYMDFLETNVSIDYRMLEEYLGTEGYLKYYLRNWDFRQSVVDARALKTYRINSNTYESLKFDRYGGIGLSPVNFQITAERWNGYIIKAEKISQEQYKFLDDICGFCYKNKLKCVYVQGPFREGFFSNLRENELNVIKNHIQTIKLIFRKNNTIFINGLEKDWRDALFVDYTHLSSKGSKVFTRYFLEKVDF